MGYKDRIAEEIKQSGRTSSIEGASLTISSLIRLVCNLRRYRHPWVYKTVEGIHDFYRLFLPHRLRSVRCISGQAELFLYQALQKAGYNHSG